MPDHKLVGKGQNQDGKRHDDHMESIGAEGERRAYVSAVIKAVEQENGICIGSENTGCKNEKAEKKPGKMISDSRPVLPRKEHQESEQTAEEGRGEDDG